MTARSRDSWRGSAVPLSGDVGSQVGTNGHFGSGYFLSRG